MSKKKENQLTEQEQMAAQVIRNMLTVELREADKSNRDAAVNGEKRHALHTAKMEGVILDRQQQIDFLKRKIQAMELEIRVTADVLQMIDAIPPKLYPEAINSRGRFTPTGISLSELEEWQDA